MDSQKQKQIFSAATLCCGILSLLMICYWYVGLVLAVAAVILGCYSWRRFGGNPMIKGGLFCAGGFLGFFVLIIAGMGLYYHMIDLW